MTTKPERGSIRGWYPLESSPEVFTSMARTWGLPEQISFHDVLSLDPESLHHIPRPVHAVILLFPDTPDIIQYRTERNECLKTGIGEEILWIPQTDLVGHSCGTFSIIHALANLPPSLSPKLQPFFSAARSAEVTDRTDLFSTCDLIRSAHNSAVKAGQTILREEDWIECDHFLSFIAATIDGETKLVEMDGNPPRTGPLDLGGSADLLYDAAKVIREEYMPRAGENVHFSVMVLAG